MNIHLIRSAEVEPHRFTAIYDLIRPFAGPVRYVIHEEPVAFSDEELEEEIWDDDRMDRKTIHFMLDTCEMTLPDPVTFVTWDSLFERGERSRKKYRIPDDEPVVVLTEYANEHNWFSAADPSGKLNLFVQTGMWDRFISDDYRHPVVYELASIPLQLKMFDSFRELVGFAHREPRGCMNDLCENKMQVGLRLRTGDICPDCRRRIESRAVDSQLVSQVFRIFEGIRTQMLFRRDFDLNGVPSRLIVDWDGRRILLADLGNRVIPLNPMEKTVFHFFLNHPEGVAFSALPDHRNEIFKLYNHYSDAGSIATIKGRVEDICANKNDGLSQVISRIRRKIEAEVPGGMAKHYVIGGRKGMKRKIKLGRELVEIV